MINRLRSDRKSGWRIEYSACDEQVAEWPAVYYDRTPAEFLRHLKKLQAQMRKDARMLERVLTYLARECNAKYYPLCPECKMVLDERMTLDERIQHVLDCLKKAGKLKVAK